MATKEILKISRKNWLRGLDGLLRDDNGKQCCLGFFCKAQGYKNSELLDVDSPDMLGDMEPISQTRSSLLKNSSFTDRGKVFVC